MEENNHFQALAKTLRLTYGELLDFPLLAPSPHAGIEPLEAMAQLEESIRFCQNCSLHIGRSRLVFGRGNPSSLIAFIGDFPSTADDTSGSPFSDESGQLLHKMILAMKLKPEEVYLTNAFKCRPPPTQTVNETHFQACEIHLKQQFALLSSKVVVAMGEAAAQGLARSEAPLRVLRRQIFSWEERQVICTHHPRDLLQSPEKKKEAWEDLQLAMRALGGNL